MKLIPLTKGYFTMVDDTDFDWLNGFRWHYAGGYSKCNGIRMHRLIMGALKGQSIDHKDLNRLNNQRSNLRFCSQLENNRNRPKTTKGQTSRFKGVSLFKPKKKLYYLAGVTIKGRVIRKVFPYSPEGEIAAAMHYNELARQHYGEFARLNEV